jgi:hypothetical protein
MLTEGNLYEIFRNLQDKFFTCDLRDFCYHLEEGSNEVLDRWEDDTEGSYAGFKYGLIDGKVTLTGTLEYRQGRPRICLHTNIDTVPFEAVKDKYEYWDDYWRHLENDVNVAFGKYVVPVVQQVHRVFRNGEEFDTFVVRHCFADGDYRTAQDASMVEFKLIISLDIDQLMAED